MRHRSVSHTADRDDYGNERTLSTGWPGIPAFVSSITLPRSNNSNVSMTVSFPWFRAAAIRADGAFNVGRAFAKVNTDLLFGQIRSSG